MWKPQTFGSARQEVKETDMGKSLKWLIVLILAGGMLAGCKRMNVPGGEINFRASSAPLSTKTAYSGERNTESGVVKERIDWLEGDEITIWSDKARMMYDETRQAGDYVFTSVEADGVRSRGKIVSSIGNGLQWTSATGTYTFYCRYPSDGTKINGEKMLGEIPASQVIQYDAETGSMKPDMQYAYLFAGTTAPANAASVTLEFRPVFTALEFEVGGGGDGQVDLTSFTITSTTDAVTGAFERSCASGNVTVTGTPGLSASLDFSQIPGGKLTVTGAAPVTVTIFAVPKDLKNLTLEVKGDQIQTRTLKLANKNGSFLTFDACKKYRILGLSLPELLKAEGEDIDWDIQAIGETLIWD